MQVKTIIKHHFYFKTTAIIASLFFILIVVLTFLYLGKRNEANSRSANDIKYRFLKLNASPTIEKTMRFTDSLYLFAPDSVKRKVEWIESHQWDNSEKAKRQEQVEKRPINGTDKKQLSK